MQKYAEVIIFPKEEELDFEISEDEKALMRKRVAEAKEEDFEDWDAIKDNFL